MAKKKTYSHKREGIELDLPPPPPPPVITKPQAGGLPSPRVRIGRPPKVDGKALERMAELARAGWSQEAIAIQLAEDGLANIRQESVGKWLRKLEEKHGAELGRRKRSDLRGARA